MALEQVPLVFGIEEQEPAWFVLGFAIPTILHQSERELAMREVFVIGKLDAEFFFQRFEHFFAEAFVEGVTKLSQRRIGPKPAMRRICKISSGFVPIGHSDNSQRIGRQQLLSRQNNCAALQKDAGQSSPNQNHLLHGRKY